MVSFNFLFYCLILTSVIFNTWAYEPELRKFTIYGYVPWRVSYNSSHQQVSDLLYSYGIQPIIIMYEDHYFTQGKIDYKKIKALALSNLKKNIPVSFDMEFGNRFKPETIIPKIKTILNSYRFYDPKAFLGIYATIPQNTYGFRPVNNAYAYAKLNNRYNSIASEIDFISPSLYNYTGHDFETWLENAKFNIETAKKYVPSKPLIPYISPIVRKGPFDKVKNGNLVEEITEEEMTKRLDSLYQLGASGCIIWASSQDRTADGKFPKFNPHKGWGKAVVHYVSTH